jgi:hypothetical protein
LRLKKKEGIQKARRLSMEAKKLARMTRMLEELSMEDMEMEVESIEIMVNEMIDIEDWAEEDDIDWQEDVDGDQVMPEVRVMDAMEDRGMDIDSAFDARSGWKSSQGGINGRVSYPMCKVEEYGNGDQAMPQVGSSMMEEMDVIKETGALGGPCHHVGEGRLLIK